MATTATTAFVARQRAPWWQTASWIGLIPLGAFNLYAAAVDLADGAGRTWASFKAAQPGVAHHISLPKRGCALHKLLFGILFLAIVAIPLRAGQRWTWQACWAVLIAYLGYTLTFGLHDHAILARSLIGAIALPCCWPRSPRSSAPATRTDNRTKPGPEPEACPHPADLPRKERAGRRNQSLTGLPQLPHPRRLADD